MIDLRRMFLQTMLLFFFLNFFKNGVTVTMIKCKMDELQDILTQISHSRWRVTPDTRLSDKELDFQKFTTTKRLV